MTLSPEEKKLIDDALDFGRRANANPVLRVRMRLKDFQNLPDECQEAIFMATGGTLSLLPGSEGAVDYVL